MNVDDYSCFIGFKPSMWDRRLINDGCSRGDAPRHPILGPNVILQLFPPGKKDTVAIKLQP
jgi:hypothetical protein